MRLKFYYEGDELVVQGYERVKTFLLNKLVLTAAKRTLIIEGKGLTCVYYAKNELIVRGEIQMLRLEDA